MIDKLLRKTGWFRCDGGRFFKHSSDDGSKKGWLQSVEFSWWNPGEFGPYLGFYYEPLDTYEEDNGKIYIGFILGRIWIGFKPKTKESSRTGFEIGRNIFYFWWKYKENYYGEQSQGKEICCFWWDKLKDLILGRTLCTTDKRWPESGFVEMPEGKYPAKFTFVTRCWTRPRSPFHKIRKSTDVEIEMGIPFSGKGENSWDCGEDALYGTGYAGWDIEACANYVRQEVLKDRKKRYDPEYWPESPEVRLAKYKELRKNKSNNQESEWKTTKPI